MRRDKLLRILRAVTLLIALVCILTGAIKGGHVGTRFILIGSISVVVSSIIALILKLY